MCYEKDGANLRDRREMLRVKLKSLAAEAKIIRAEEKRTHGLLRHELHSHRVREVRSEARHTHLAYGFIRGRTYAQMERSPLKGYPPDWERVRKMTKRYGPAGFAFAEPAIPKP